MRLAAIRRGDSFKHRAIFFLIRLTTRRPPPDVVKMLMYRSEFLGRPLSNFFQSCLRGPSHWTIGERELFAAFTSRLNECRF